MYEKESSINWKLYKIPNIWDFIYLSIYTGFLFIHFGILYNFQFILDSFSYIWDFIINFNIYWIPVYSRFGVYWFHCSNPMMPHRINSKIERNSIVQIPEIIEFVIRCSTVILASQYITRLVIAVVCHYNYWWLTHITDTPEITINS
jgi:hypothetical protein